MRETEKSQNRKIIFSIFFLLLATLLTSKIFKKVNLEDITIQGSELFSLDDILKNSSINFPTPLLFIKTQYAEQNLKKNLSLENVLVTRQILPFGLKILVETRTPIAYGEKISNGQKIKGFIDKDGFFIDERYSDKTKMKELVTYIFGWEKGFSNTISKILNFSKNKKIYFQTINFSPNGFITLEEVNLKKIMIGNNTSIIETQLQIISNLKNQLSDKNLLNKIDTIDLTDPENPKIKVFKP